MPSNLTDNYVANTYKGILHVNGDELPENTLVQVYDGAGNETAMKLSAEVVECISINTQGLTANDLKYPTGPGNVNDVMCQVSDNFGTDILSLKSIQEVFCDSNIGATYKRTDLSRVPIFETKCGIVSGASDILITDVTAAAGGVTTVERTGNFIITQIKPTGGILTALAVKELVLPISKNLLHNAQGNINQRQILPNGSLYSSSWNPMRCFLDRWRVLGTTSAPGVLDTQGYGGTVKTITIPTGDSLGVEQRVESINVVPGQYTLSWYGNATATVFHGFGNNYPIVYTGLGTVVTGDLKTATFTIPNTPGNIVVRFTGAGLYFYLPKLERGSSRTEFDFREFGAELALCQRYFSKTYPYANRPQYGATRDGAIQHHGVEPINPVSHNLQWRFPAEQPPGNIAYAFSPVNQTGPSCFTISGQFDADEERDFETHTCNVRYSTSAVRDIERSSGGDSKYPSGRMRLAMVHYIADGETGLN